VVVQRSEKGEKMIVSITTITLSKDDLQKLMFMVKVV
jgi:hypothetical protein